MYAFFTAFKGHWIFEWVPRVRVCVWKCSVLTVYTECMYQTVLGVTQTHTRTHTLSTFLILFFFSRSVRKIWFQEPGLIAMHPYKCVANCNLWSMTMQCDDATNRFICIYSMVQFINHISNNYPDGVFLVHYIHVAWCNSCNPLLFVFNTFVMTRPCRWESESKLITFQCSIKNCLFLHWAHHSKRKWKERKGT